MTTYNKQIDVKCINLYNSYAVVA